MNYSGVPVVTNYTCALPSSIPFISSDKQISITLKNKNNWLPTETYKVKFNANFNPTISDVKCNSGLTDSVEKILRVEISTGGTFQEF